MKENNKAKSELHVSEAVEGYAHKENEDLETTELLNNPEFLDSFEKAKRDRAQGNYARWEDVRRDV